jgi:DNA-binding GntR family transcriptional regulator
MKTIKRMGVVLEVAAQIRTAILEGGLVPGSRIAQDAIAAELGVSRLPIRQALLVLQREGLVVLDHGRGAVVAPIDIKFIADLFDFRASVDGTVVALLAARRDFDVSELNGIVKEGLAAAGRGETRWDLIVRFHLALYEATGNQVLVKTMEPLLEHAHRVVSFVNQSMSGTRAALGRKNREQPGLRSRSDTWNEHAAIVEAIASHSVGRARTLARSHIEQGKQVAVAFLVSSTPSRPDKTAAGRRHSPPVSLGDYFKRTVSSRSR